MNAHETIPQSPPVIIDQPHDKQQVIRVVEDVLGTPLDCAVKMDMHGRCLAHHAVRVSPLSTAQRHPHRLHRQHLPHRHLRPRRHPVVAQISGIISNVSVGTP